MKQVSTHTPLTGRDLFVCLPRFNTNISTHTPLAGRDAQLTVGETTPSISTHTPLAGRDSARSKAVTFQALFLLTRPSRGATQDTLDAAFCYQISTHTPLAGRDLDSGVFGVQKCISTHTPLAGRDLSSRGATEM